MYHGWQKLAQFSPARHVEKFGNLETLSAEMVSRSVDNFRNLSNKGIAILIAATATPARQIHETRFARATVPL